MSPLLTLVWVWLSLGLCAPALAETTPLDAPLLERDALIATVLAVNPGLAAAEALSRAAAARPAQAAAWPSATIGLMTSVAMRGMDDQPRQILDLAVPLSLSGERWQAGQAASAEARASEADLEAVRQQLALRAARAWDDWYALHRDQEANRALVGLLRQASQSAAAGLEAGRLSLDAALMAQMEAAHAEHEDLVIAGELTATRAELNALLHRPPDAPLAPPADLRLPDLLPTLGPRDLGEARPELDAAEARTAAARSALAAAKASRWPEVEAMARVSGSVGEPMIGTMLGLSVMVPARARSRAAVDEASAALRAAESGALALADEVAAEAASAAARLDEAHCVRDLYDDQLLPLAAARVEAARARVQAGLDDAAFEALLKAEAALAETRRDRERAQARLATRWTAWELATGRLVKEADHE